MWREMDWNCLRERKGYNIVIICAIIVKNKTIKKKEEKTYEKDSTFNHTYFDGRSFERV